MIQSHYIQVTVYDELDSITNESQVIIEGVISGNRHDYGNTTIGLSVFSGFFSDIDQGINLARDSLKIFDYMGLPEVKWRHAFTQTTGVFKDTPTLRDVYKKLNAA